MSQSPKDIIEELIDKLCGFYVHIESCHHLLMDRLCPMHAQIQLQKQIENTEQKCCSTWTDIRDQLNLLEDPAEENVGELPQK